MPGAAAPAIRPPGGGEAARLRGGAWPRSGRGIDRPCVCRPAGSAIGESVRGSGGVRRYFFFGSAEV